MPDILLFRTGIYVAGSYSGPGATAPILRTSAGAAINMTHPPANGSHFSLSFPPSVPAPRPRTSTSTTPYLCEGAPVRDGNTGGTRIPFVAPGAGVRVAYLPFVQRMITSTIIPGNPASNVSFFYTDNLSGCSIFIDRIAGSNDLIVYHANREDLTRTPNPAQYLATTPFANQFTPARNMMRIHHTAAQAELSAAMGGVNLNNVARLERADYFACIEREKDRKRQQGRHNVDIGAAGTNVMGFRIPGGAWEFWWQAWAILTYDRPWNAPRGIISRHQGVHIGTGKLLAAQRFFT